MPLLKFPRSALRGGALRMLLLPITTTAGMAIRPPAAAGVGAAAGLKKRHALLTFGFVGTDFYGLQSQSAEGDPNRPTVSDVIRQALLKQGFILESNFVPLERSKWTLASRTDKGVHAACAAASVKIETHGSDVRLDDDSEADADARTALMSAPTKAVASDWSLSPEALGRINAALPPSVRVFSGGYVRKRFDAREAASCRTYEYLLPASAVAASAPELDAVLRRFEGTHRMHNFASGLRLNQQSAGEYTCDATGLSWPLALTKNAQSAAYRSVLTCRVHREVEVAGEPYMVLRIAGLAFVLHQIRHMIGAALAVTNGIVPVDALEIALSSPLRVDVSPLVPGMGLLLDEIEWFDVRTGEYEARLSPATREVMEAFKMATLYPHIHQLYAAGAYEHFLAELRSGNFTKQLGAESYEALRVVHAAHREHVMELAQQRREQRAARRAAYHQEQQMGEASSADSSDGGGGSGAGASGGAPQLLRDGGQGGGNQRRPRKAPKESELPGGMLVQICVARQQRPGPETHRVHQLLKDKVKSGELEPNQPYEYYFDALARYGA